LKIALPKEVGRQIRSHAMLPAGGLGIVAVSGGADSVALLLALHELGCKVLVAHLNHGIRGRQADRDAAFAHDLAARLGLECVIERRDVPGYRREHHLSLEAAARAVRYGFLRSLAAERGASAIFLGHTADDQVETFLLRLLRGAGIAGLAGMQFKDDLLCRPMLGLWRSDVEHYLRDRGQEWREDPSNRDPRFLRNRVRHELLPLLASMNPGIKRVLLREAELLSARQREVEAEVLRRLGLNARQIKAALAGKPVALKGGIRLEAIPELKPQEQAIDQPLHIPGLVELPGIGTIRTRAVLVSGHLPPDVEPGYVEYVDLELIDGQPRIRSWKPGDRFVPLGMSQQKKLQDFFVDERVPAERRPRVPLVVSGNAIVWVVGMRIDERFKLTPSTTRALRLQFEPCD
jgi:tRNA(Ile)-lysidine synthase